MQLLTIIDGNDHGKQFYLEGDAFGLGRDVSCDIVLNDDGVSRNHALLEYADDCWFVSDQGSTNGTFVNNSRVSGRVMLRGGDKIAMGNTTLLYQGRATSNYEIKTPSDSSPSVILEESEGSATQVSLPAHSETGILLKELSRDTAKVEKHFGLLYDFMLRVSSVLSTEQLFDVVLDLMFEHLPADRVMILLKNGPGVSLIPVAYRVNKKELEEKSVSISRTIASEVLDTGESILIRDVLSAVNLKQTVAFQRFQPTSLMCAPLKMHDKIFGLIYMDALMPSMVKFEKSDLQLLTAMAIQVAVSYENARLYESLLNTTAFNSNILRNVGSAILTVDNEGVVTKANNTAQNFIRASEADITRKSINELQDLEELKAIINNTTKSGLPEEYHCIYVNRGGEKVPISINTSVIEDHSGNVVGVIANFRDISKEEKLRRQLQKSQKLAVLGEMSAAVAHEIRNPLNSIRGFSQLLQEQVDAENREYADIVLREVDRMNVIIQDLLDFARQKDIPMSTIDICKVVHETVEQLKPDAKENNVSIIEDVDEQGLALHQITGNADKLKQVIMNIINNAVQACSQKMGDNPDPGYKGLVTISCEKSARAGLAYPEVVINITDNGNGINEESLKKIFDPFYTEKEYGTGLGLPICEKIIEAHRGEILVSSRPGDGSMFSIYLPEK